MREYIYWFVLLLTATAQRESWRASAWVDFTFWAIAMGVMSQILRAHIIRKHTRLTTPTRGSDDA